MMTRIFLSAAIVYAAIMGASAQSAKPEAPMPKYSYWDDWTDHNGVSHMTHCEVNSFRLSSMSPPADPQWQSKQPESGAQVIFTVQPAGWKGAWHEDPKPQWIIPLKGTWFVEAMDGTRATLGPGDISLGEDQNTVPDAQGHKGHLAGNVGKGPVSLMVIQLAVTPTVDNHADSMELSPCLHFPLAVSTMWALRCPTWTLHPTFLSSRSAQRRFTTTSPARNRRWKARRQRKNWILLRVRS